MDTPFGDNPLAIVSAQYSIPEDSPYTQDLHNLIGYLLTSDPELRPSIWQVCEVVSRITGTTNHVTNVFRSPCPPNTLPSPKNARPVAKKPTNQSKPSITVTLPLTLLLQQLPRHPFQLRVKFVMATTSIEPEAVQSECRIPLERRQWTGCFWLCPIHSTKNRIRDQPDHSDWQSISYG
ncbi:AP2-associated protein kinase 1-like [Halichondria panicea]|uniref:AP2-associated protein kinase 1-like n=1 Tax=Halichondria panicea TaxID=6063 RepID=UPI00312B49E4